MQESDISQLPAQSDRGCLRMTLIGLLVVFGLGMALVVGLLVAGFFTAQRVVTQPIQQVGEFVRQLGQPVTPEIRPNTITIVREINNLAQLQTASYQLEKIVTARQGRDFPFGLLEESLIFVAVGEVTAGVDLAKLTQADIRATTFQTVTVRLPEAEVFVATLNNQESYIADRDTGLLVGADPQLETQVRQQAEQVILEAALEAGILETAEENAETVLTGLFRSLGFQAVIFVDGELPPPGPVEDPELPKGFIIEP